MCLRFGRVVEISEGVQRQITVCCSVGPSSKDNEAGLVGLAVVFLSPAII